MITGKDMRIVFTDETTDGRFSSSNISENVVQNALAPKTEKAVSAGKNANMFVTLGKKKIDSATGGIGSKVSTMITKASPVLIATMALTMVEKLWSEWRRRELERNEWKNTVAMRAGSELRGDVNMRNQRVSIITGKVSGTKSRIRG